MDKMLILLKNKHMLIVLLIVLGIQISSVWIPKYKTQLDQTQTLIMGYAIAIANASKKDVLPPPAT